MSDLRRQSPPPTAYSIPDTIGYDPSSATAKPHQKRQVKAVIGRESRNNEFNKHLTPL